ncbi:MAG: YbfB/YjiJ family transporter, partial [Paucimonas sp.]|nr:YbfB/YjiJ family transporter [Paucimonas sp.]
MPADPPTFAHRLPIWTAFALSLGAAVSLGISRFAYGLLLPPMRSDLEWSYFLAGAMNTGNALGYFIGALATPYVLRRWGAQACLTSGSMATGLFMLMSGFAVDTGILMLQRVLAGMASAFIFIAGGLLAARLGSLHPQRAGLLIGIYYGGTGLGIMLSAFAVPLAMEYALRFNALHGWQWAWIALGITCIAASFLMTEPSRHLDVRQSGVTGRTGLRIRDFAFGLSGYFMFGVGYIGYMTFIVALLREQHMSSTAVTLFYALLGLTVVASSRIWAGMLDRFKGGQSLAILNALLGCATLLPAFTAAPFAIFFSGTVFGAVFLS